LSNQELIQVPILILANKQDHVDAISAKSIKEAFAGIVLSMLGTRDCRVQPATTLRGYVGRIHHPSAMIPSSIWETQ
jgi:hypothetical protein